MGVATCKSQVHFRKNKGRQMYDQFIVIKSLNEIQIIEPVIIFSFTYPSLADSDKSIGHVYTNYAPSFETIIIK